MADGHGDIRLASPRALAMLSRLDFILHNLDPRRGSARGRFWHVASSLL